MFHVPHLHPGRRLIPLCLCLATSLAAQVGLGLAPMRLDVPVLPGQRQNGVLALTNESNVPVRIRTELLDFRIDDGANPFFAPSIESEWPYSCRQWLAINPMEFELGANERRLVRYSIRVPDEARAGSFHCAVGFTTAPPSSRSDAIGMRTNVRVISALYPIVGELTIDGTILGLAIESPQEAVVTVANRGQRVFRAVGTMDLVDPSGKVVHSSPVPTVPILPDRKQRLPVRYDPGRLKAGLRLRVRIDIGAGEMLEASVNVDALP